MSDTTDIPPAPARMFRPDQIVAGVVIVAGTLGCLHLYFFEYWYWSNTTSSPEPISWVELLVLGPLVLPQFMLFKGRPRWSLFLAAIVFTHFIAGLFTFHTAGEIMSALMLVIAWMYALPAVLLTRSGQRWRVFGCAIATIIWLLIVPRETVMVHRWYAVRSECENVLKFVESYRSEYGRLPEDLAGYTYLHPWTNAYFWYQPERGGYQPERHSRPGPHIAYWIANANAAHGYDPEYGWEYYPD